jgi:hypothetical protein
LVYPTAVGQTDGLQEATDKLYLIPAIDMLNHSSRPSLRNTSLALIRSEAEVTLGDGTKRRFKDFFSMKAGAQMLLFHRSTLVKLFHCQWCGCRGSVHAVHSTALQGLLLHGSW